MQTNMQITRLRLLVCGIPGLACPGLDGRAVRLGLRPPPGAGVRAAPRPVAAGEQERLPTVIRSTSGGRQLRKESGGTGNLQRDSGHCD